MFQHIFVLTHEGDGDRVKPFTDALNRAAKERGIRLDQESDALDLSRDVIIDEAVQAAGGNQWALRGDALYFTTLPVDVSWFQGKVDSMEAERTA